MPRGNGMGPMGKGPMTGRAAGFCAANGQTGVTIPNFGRGYGFSGGRGIGGQGRGRHGCRNQFVATGLPGGMRAGGHTSPAADIATAAEKQVLTIQAEALQTQLDAVKRHLEALETK